MMKRTAREKSKINFYYSKRTDPTTKYSSIDDYGFNINIEKSKWVFSPDSYWKMSWDIVGMVFILYQCVFVPYRLCFEDPAINGMAVFELIQDFFFISDILLSANTGYYEKGSLVLIRSKIICNYLKLWFWLDIAASFPYSLVVNKDEYFSLSQSTETATHRNASKVVRVLRFLRFMRILRLLRVIKLQKIFAKVLTFLTIKKFIV